ncbi:MAG TPA: type IV toxin-antitoxin system AbiEi family antitoxin domain-containing protein [Mycobacteriales bacterium]|nr:type IV toxin-antitoxin system AbiEi family antitoxin domain-containing protein [Mycobacteriales bacterium]
MNSPLLTVARQQGGLVTYRQARGLGWSRSSLDRFLAGMGWTRVIDGVYLEPGRTVDFPLEIRARQLANPDLVAARSAAAVVLGVAGLRPRLEFISGDAGHRSARGMVHREALRPDEVTVVDGIRATTPLRTVLDVLRHCLSGDGAVAVLDSALRSGSVQLDAIAAGLIDARARRGVVTAWRRFAAADPKAESVLETLARLRMREAGMRPLSQVLVPTANGRQVRLDFLVDGVGVELEGARYHGGIVEHQQDVRRFNLIAGAGQGIPILRFTWDDVVRHPVAMVATIRATIAGLPSARQPIANPSGRLC